MIREQLRLITEKAKSKCTYEEEVRQFGEYILKDWVLKCAEAANEGRDTINILAFRIETMWGNFKIVNLVDNGLTEYIEKVTELTVKYAEYFIDKKTGVMVELKNRLEFDQLFSDNIFVHFGVISLSWENLQM